MLHEMNSELFVELTEEQAQVVTGGSYGGGYGDQIKDYLSTYYTQKDQATLLEVTQVSGPGGSANVQKFANIDKSVETGANKYFDFNGNW